MLPSPAPGENPTAFSPLPEAALLEQCRSGNLAAFDELVRRHQDKVFSLCLWILGDRDEAADAAQDAFVRAFRALAKFRGEAAFGTWLHRIALNVARDAANRRKRAPLPFSSFEGDDDRPFDPPATGVSPVQSLLKDERRRAVREALARLAEHHRLVLVLFDLQGHSYEEVAGLLKLPMGTVKSRLNRARSALRDALEPQRELFEGGDGS